MKHVWDKLVRMGEVGVLDVGDSNWTQIVLDGWWESLGGAPHQWRRCSMNQSSETSLTSEDLLLTSWCHIPQSSLGGRGESTPRSNIFYILGEKQQHEVPQLHLFISCLFVFLSSRVAFRDWGLHPEQQEKHRPAQWLLPDSLPRPLLQRPHLLLWPDADLQVRSARAHLHSSLPDCSLTTLCVCRISAAGQMDRRDSLGVCIDSERGEESLQRDQAVCISTNGKPTQTGWAFGLLRQSKNTPVRLMVILNGPSVCDELATRPVWTRAVTIH